METFLQAVALALIGVILILVLGKQRQDMALLLSLGVCTAVCIAGAGYLGAVVDFLRELRSLGELDREFLTILLKCCGIGFLSELAGLICADAGQNALSRAVQMLANAAILFLSLPLLRQLVTLLQEVLGQI